MSLRRVWFLRQTPLAFICYGFDNGVRYKLLKHFSFLRTDACWTCGVIEMVRWAFEIIPVVIRELQLTKAGRAFWVHDDFPSRNLSMHCAYPPRALCRWTVAHQNHSPMWSISITDNSYLMCKTPGLPVFRGWHWAILFDQLIEQKHEPIKIDPVGVYWLVKLLRS